MYIHLFLCTHTHTHTILHDYIRVITFKITFILSPTMTYRTPCPVMSTRNWGRRNKEHGNPRPGYPSVGVSSHLIPPCRPRCPKSSCVRKERPFTLSCEQIMCLVLVTERQGQASWLSVLGTWLSVTHYQAIGPFPPTSTRHPFLQSSGLCSLPPKSGQEEHQASRITHLNVSLCKRGVDLLYTFTGVDLTWR